MIRLASKKLAKSEQDILDDLQAKINAEVSFTDKAAKAQSLWNSKGGTKGKAAFKIILASLEDMCVFVKVCNYCEQSEANDIEHIFPKSFFPGHTFDWDNYILACKQCNSGFKLDKGYVFDTHDNLVELVREQEPPFPTIAFINIRTESPEDFMMLNAFTHKFDLLPGLTKAGQNKALATLKILELNERDTLIAARRSAAKHYYETLQRLIRILNVSTIAELEIELNPYDDRFDLTQALDDVKSQIRDSYKNYIATYQHPSVWHTIKLVQSKVHPRWIDVFAHLPEALKW